MKVIVRSALAATVLAALSVADCAIGTADSMAAPGPGSAEYVDAHRFLLQATFGPREGEVATLLGKGSTPIAAYERWIDEQMSIRPSLQLPVLRQADLAKPTAPNSERQTLRKEIWARYAVTAPDQLRQRVAFAMSEILVVSQLGGGLTNSPFGLADYYDVIARNAFGNFRLMIEQVTLHPAMGAYLNMLGNRKPDTVNNIRPDENFARELMQLFTIGLVQLDGDGTARLDASGAPLATYDQAVVEGFAHVFTGWHYAGTTTFSRAMRTKVNQAQPMQLYPEQHDTGAKRLLSYAGAIKSQLPAGQPASQDLADALDNVFNHPNVGPFLSRQLIQKLVASNPSPAYVQRVSGVFDDDGAGRRGNLAAVVKAILLDPEARGAPAVDIDGKLKEPMLRLLQFWRAYDAKAADGRFFRFTNPEVVFGEGVLMSPSVFNFFSPAFAPMGEISARGLVAPESQIATEYFNTTATNYFGLQIITRNSARTNTADTIVIDIADEMALATDPVAMVNLIGVKLFGGQMPAILREHAVGTAMALPATRRLERTVDALFVVATSPDFAAQR